MATEFTTLDALQALHRDLLALREGRAEQAEALGLDEIVGVFQAELGKIWNRPEKSATERQSVTSGKIVLNGEEFNINDEFRHIVLNLSDEAEVSELEVARILLDAQDDVQAMGRPLLQCGLVRFHQQRKYTLDSLRLLLELDRLSEEETSEVLDQIRQFIDAHVFVAPPGATQRPAERCISSMTYVRTLLKKVVDKMTAASFLGQDRLSEFSGEMQTVEFNRVSLYQQHELLGVVLSRIIEKGLGQQQDSTDLLDMFKKADRYDALLVHMLPAFAAIVDRNAFEGDWAKMKPAMTINTQLSTREDNSPWVLQYMQAGLRAWWLVEYSGFFVEEPPEGTLDRTINIDQEDKQKTKDFTDALKDGAFDFLLALVADVKAQEWQDPARAGMRQWLQRKTPGLATEWTQFSDFFQTCLVQHLEVFVDAFISNLPDVLRRLRVEEDEQRQLSQTHEHDLDLERFLIIIAYTYEGRPEAAMSFWTDPDSNLAGFMHWASRRASTPLVTAFCEMLQAISENEECANAAHEFLLDEGHHASGKMRRSQSLTWQQIFRELVFFSNKIREKPSPTQSVHRHGKPSTEQAEAEPESAMMLECYLRLMTKLATVSESARQFLLRDASPSVIDILFQLAGSQIPTRLRACVFSAVRALLARKTLEEGHTIWQCLDSWMTGGYGLVSTMHHRAPHNLQPLNSMERVFEELGSNFEESLAFIQLLTTLVQPSEDNSPLNDGLPFPENLGTTFRMAGIEPYVDFVIGHVFGIKSSDVLDVGQLRMLRLACLDFALASLDTFNEELIVLANSTNMMVDNVIATTDLATYVRLHPFSRVMEWMFNDKVISSLFNTAHQEPNDVNNASPGSPLLQGIMRAVQVISKVLELQATYLDLVRPVLKQHGNQRRAPVANQAYSSLEDGLVTHLKLVVDLGIYCGLGHADLTLACLKLLEKMSASPRICSIWSSSHSRHSGRNKAIVALETDGEHEPIARSLISDLRAPLQPQGESDSPSYLIKIYILEFLYTCLKQSPRRPTIAHLLLGFKCGTDTLSIEPEGAFDSQASLFHALLSLLIETPSCDDSGMRQWMVALRSKAISILQILWSSPLSAALVLEELRMNEFLFHLLLKEVVIQPNLLWEGESVGGVHFCITGGSVTLVNFVTLRAWALDYMAMELCSIAQTRQPALKRRILEALNGSISADGGERIDVPTIFDLYDFQLPADAWDIPAPPLTFYANLELDSCRETDRHGRPVYNIDRVSEILLLKQAENRMTGQLPLATAQDLATVDREEAMIVEWLTTANHQSQIMAEALKVLKTWTRLLLVMIESNDFKGTARTSFFLQCLQAILPSLEGYATDRPVEALELAKLARILLSKLDLSDSDAFDGEIQAVGNLISERLYQLFQICLAAIGRWSGDSELRAIYYSICFRYISGMADPMGPLASSRHKAANAVHMYGERLLNVVCDDATGGDIACQTAALILLGSLVTMGIQEGDGHVIEGMNRLNFVGILVDSLKHVLEEWMMVIDTGNTEQQHYHQAKLALLLQLAQTREGAKHIVNANIFRSLQLSDLFAADPELQANPEKPKALEQLYSLLVTVARIVSAAIVSRGSHNTIQGLRFLRDYRTLVSHTLKRSAGIGPAVDGPLEEQIGELADAFMVLITATGFLEAEEKEVVELHQKNTIFYH